MFTKGEVINRGEMRLTVMNTPSPNRVVVRKQIFNSEGQCLKDSIVTVRPEVLERKERWSELDSVRGK